MKEHILSVLMVTLNANHPFNHAAEQYLDRVYFKDARSMSELPADSMHLIITSPPYFNVKDYSLDGRQQKKTGEKVRGQLGRYFRL